MRTKLVIAVDFDGTCVTHDFPNVGKDIGAANVLRKLVANGHKLILWTMRSDAQEPRSYDKDILERADMHLSDAVNWFEENGIELWGVQTNPEQSTWTTSPKAYAQLYIDDAALGCPLMTDNRSNRPFVDWYRIAEMLIAQNIIDNAD